MLQSSIRSLVLTFAAMTTGLLGGAPAVLAAVPTELATAPVRHAIAQADSETDFDGNLSVTGTSQVSVPADQAIIVLTFYPSSYYSGDYSDSDAPQPVQVQPADLSAVVDAIAATGVASEDIAAYPDYTSPGSMRVRVRLAQPTQLKIAQIMDVANTAVTKTNRFTANGSMVGYTVQNCQSVEAQARQSAMADAQQRAAALAEVAQTQLGEIWSLSESVTWGNSYSSTCPSSSDPAAYSDSYSLPAYDPTMPPIVKVVYSLSITYNMR